MSERNVLGTTATVEAGRQSGGANPCGAGPHVGWLSCIGPNRGHLVNWSTGQLLTSLTSCTPP